jgi:ABC-2 type transport system permease protein
MITRIFSIIRKEFIQMSRDRRTVIVTLVMPVMQLFLLGYAGTTDVSNVPLVVLDQSKSPQSQALLDAFRGTGYFTFAYVVNDEAELERLINGGQAKTGLIIPPDYGDKIASGQTVAVAFIIDGSDPGIASSALSAAILLGQAESTRLEVQQLSRQGVKLATTPLIDMRTQVWYNPNLISAFFIVPGLIGMLLQTTTTQLTASSIVRERERGTIEQLIVTPIRSMELIIGKLVPNAIVAFGTALEVLLVGTLWFHVPVRGSIGLLLAMTGLFALTILNIGMFISTLAHTQQEAQIMSVFLLLPSMVLSGFFFPIAAMPQALQWASRLIPLTYFLIIVRGIVLKGAGLSLLLPEVGALVAFAILVVVLAISRFHKRLD